MRFFVTLVASLVIVSAVGCVERSRNMSSTDRQQLQRFVSQTEPHPAHALNAKFEDKITLLGYDVQPATVRPGETVTITWYWKCEKKTGDGWRLFTHLVDASGTNRLNQDGVGFVRERYQPFQWQAGEYIRDEQRITVPADWNSQTLRPHLGIWKDAARMRIVSGPKDNDNRVPAAIIPVLGAPAVQPQQPAEPIRLNKATTPIRIDGRLDEPAWQQAYRSEAFVNTMTGGESDAKARARMTWDENNFYIAFEVQDEFLKSTHTNRDDHLWEQDTIEVMVDPMADQRNYFEIQVAPTGNIFDTRYDTRRQPQPVGDLAWNSRVNSKVATRGTPNDDDDDQGYTVELAFPWADFAAGPTPAAVPTNGTTWAINLYVMDTPEEGGQKAAGWTAVREPDFHAVGNFRRITFVDPTAAAAPAQQATAATAEAPAAAETAPAAPQLDLRALPAEARERLQRAVTSQMKAQGAPSPLAHPLGRNATPAVR